jgi:hypothetical protein
VLLPALLPGSGIGSVVCEGVTRNVAAAATTTAATATTVSRRFFSILFNGWKEQAL